jgi:serine/threonine protein kinase
MDFCAKGELFNYIVVKQRLSEKKSAFFYYQLINGIEYIHKKGVCHRDLKPENLLLTEKNKLKIIDFGLSNYFNGNLLETPCGSPCYASPEMVRGHKYDGFKIDIWSSGIILYAMLCGYLPFEEMENDDCNEVLFKNIMECNVEYPPEFIPPDAKSLLKKILVKDPRRRITIEEIKMENFYLLGEIIYKQTFENLGNLDLNEYIYCLDDKDRYYNFNEYLKNSNDNLLENEYLYFNEKMRKNNEDLDLEIDTKKSKEDKDKEKDKEKDIVEKEIVKNIEPNKFMTPIKSEENENIDLKNKNSVKKNLDNYEKDDMLEKIKKMTAEKKNQKIKKINEQKDQIENKENINSQKNTEKKNSFKKEKPKENNQISIKKLSPEMLYNVPVITCSNEKKETKVDKLQKEYSVQEDYNKIHNENSNMNLNYKEINMKNQYLKTEIYPSNLRSKTKPKKNNYKLLNKKKANNNNLIAFDNILKVLQNKNTQKTKTLKPYSTKKNAPVKTNMNKSNQSNSLNKKKYCSYSPGIKKVSKNGKNLINDIEKNIHFPRQNNYYPLTTHENIKNNYNALSNDIMKYFNSNIFLKNNNNNVHYNYNDKNKSFKPNKKFVPYKENKNKYITNLNTFNNENYFRINNNIKTKNNDEKKFVKYSLNNALNFKSFEYYLINNTSKRNNNAPPEKKINNDININKESTEINSNIYNNNTNNNITKKSLGNLKGTPYLENLLTETTKPILINTSCIRKNTEVNTKRKNKNLSTNRRVNNNKVRIISNKNSKSKNRNKKHSLSHKMNHMYNKDNIDNNIIINFNILKPNIILDHQKSSSRKLKTNKYALNPKGMHHNIFTNKIDRPITESNFCSTVRSNFFNKSNKNRQNNFKNIDMKHLKKNKEINQIIRSIHDLNKK